MATLAYSITEWGNYYSGDYIVLDYAKFLDNVSGGRKGHIWRRDSQ
ncbi:MAG TPA: hypothetical protein G4O10_03325 [Dehalococcoidia bacterium]|nr:hypothetical protein [Dehalococcoidia bacterium]